MKGVCHCGAVTWTLQNRPEKLTDCNCSICRKLGAIWAHAPLSEVTIHGDTMHYVRTDSDGDIAFHFCKTCGATTHWSPSKPEGDYMAVNIRLAEPEQIKSIPVRRFDGADTWKYLD